MSGAPGIVNQTPRTIRSYIVVIFTPNPTYIHTCKRVRDNVS